MGYNCTMKRDLKVVQKGDRVRLLHFGISAAASNYATGHVVGIEVDPCRGDLASVQLDRLGVTIQTRRSLCEKI